MSEQQVDPAKVCTINSITEIADVYHFVIQDVIKNVKNVFRDENISQFVVQDLEALWTSKFMKMRQNVPVTLVPVKIMAPGKKTPEDPNPIREIEIMVPQHEAELLDFRTIFSEGIMNAVQNLSDRTAATFLQQRINNFLVSKDEVEEMICVKEEVEDSNEHPMVNVKEEIDIVENIKQEVIIKEELPQYDGEWDSSDESSDTESSSSLQVEENESSCGEDGDSLNSGDDVTDEDIDTLFDCDNVILCQYLNVLRCKNKWRFYFKDAVMNIDGSDYAFHKIFGDAPW